MLPHQKIAEICHEVNRAYCGTLGDHSQVAWQDAPAWQRESAIAGVQFWSENRDAPPSAGHDAWAARKAADGWTYGPTKDPERKTHPCMVPFELLPHDEQTKDVLFRAVALACFKPGCG